MMGEHPSEARILLAFDGELDAGELVQLMTHLDLCPACRATWERLASLSGEIQQYCQTWPPAQAAVSGRAARLPAALAAAAALLLAIAGGAALLRSGPSGEVARATTHTQDIRLASLGTPAAIATPTLTPPPRRARGPASTRTAARAAAQAANARREPTYYWALPYANGALPLSEGAVVMTVRLSRDQLRLAGIPVSLTQPASDQSLVRARVLVGADGLPRAISFDQN